jgi:hypothetical protein
VLCAIHHPGKEHGPDRDGVKDWNQYSHRRKFLEFEGRCVRRGKKFDGPLRFWAEWEPQSGVMDISEPVTNGPRFVHRPFYVVPRSYHGLQNTDPFVFGGFFYTGCQQRTKLGATQMSYLDRGSVILFGSCVDGRFAIDTVFVVDQWEDHDATNYKKLHRLKLPAAFREVTLAAWYRSQRDAACSPRSRNESYRLYRGATIDNPIDGMFSYFPCEPAGKCRRGFARPAIAIPKVITNKLLQGKRLNRGIPPSQVKELWENVRQQVESAGQWLGVAAGTPKRRVSV